MAWLCARRRVRRVPRVVMCALALLAGALFVSPNPSRAGDRITGLRKTKKDA